MLEYTGFFIFRLYKFRCYGYKVYFGILLFCLGKSFSLSY